jgi:hypothetical protein
MKKLLSWLGLRKKFVLPPIRPKDVGKTLYWYPYGETAPGMISGHISEEAGEGGQAFRIISVQADGTMMLVWRNGC